MIGTLGKILEISVQPTDKEEEYRVSIFKDQKLLFPTIIIKKKDLIDKFINLLDTL
jgi:hypothetical protein